MTNIYLPCTYYALALDPIHVGTGGYRLGQVDLTILREPGSDLPKLPGSSLAGAARAYTAMVHGKYRRQQHFDTQERQIRPVSCAGKGGEDGSEHCGKPDCEVCVTYGFTIGPESRSFHGMAQFYDAHVLFFPVGSIVGPVWITCPATLSDAGFEVLSHSVPSGEQIRVAPGLVPQPADGQMWGLNLGWLFLQIGGTFEVKPPEKTKDLPSALSPLMRRLVLVPDTLFGRLVNDNLEVRTSVSIDPATGAAEDKALFTYEALPRSTVFRFDVVYHNPRQYIFPSWDDENRKIQPTTLEYDARWVEHKVVDGLRLMEHLGVGGMNTRGFGRLRILNLPVRPGDP